MRIETGYIEYVGRCSATNLFLLDGIVRSFEKMLILRNRRSICILLETQAKLYIQDLIKSEEIAIVTPGEFIRRLEAEE